MKQKKKTAPPSADVIPLYGRDEMNLIEFPFGPITSSSGKTFEVTHPVWDRKLGREVQRKLLITGSDAFGLPRPIDDQVLMGMKALTHEAGFQSKRVEFSRYRLCKILGWSISGRSYKRLEESFDRIAGTTLKFKDSWWDKGENDWLSKTFHLIDEVELCSRDRFDRARATSDRGEQFFCSFVWSDTIWKSFADGFIKKIDMKMWRRISGKPRKEVALRLYRILDKRFYRKAYVSFDVARLCHGTLGVSRNYAPSQMLRVVARASEWLVECGFLREVRFKTGKSGRPEAVFIKAHAKERGTKSRGKGTKSVSSNNAVEYFKTLSLDHQERLLTAALEFCNRNNHKLFDGFKRHEEHRGDVFKSYREQVIHCYLLHRKKEQANAA